MFAWVMTGTGRGEHAVAVHPAAGGARGDLLGAGAGDRRRAGDADGRGADELHGPLRRHAGRRQRASGADAVLGWHPWAVIRVISFVAIGVVLSAPLLSRIATFRVDWIAARAAAAVGRRRALSPTSC